MAGGSVGVVSEVASPPTRCSTTSEKANNTLCYDCTARWEFDEDAHADLQCLLQPP